MDLRHLRYFVALAEELHVTRAAERLGIRQPPLSIQIKQVEREVGAPLFRRLSRGVELTEVGRAFLVDAHRVLATMERAISTAQSRARGQIGALRVGFGGATYLPPEVPAAILRYREYYPDVALTPIQSNTPALVAALQAGETDVAFVRPPCDLGSDLRLEPFLVEEMAVVLPAHHRLGGKRPVDLKDLAGETFILFPREVGPGLHDSIIGACLQAGFSPHLGQAASQIVSAVPMVAAGFGVSVVPGSVMTLDVPGVSYCRLKNKTLTAPISFAWRTADRSPTLAHFVQSLRSSSRARRHERPIGPKAGITDHG